MILGRHAIFFSGLIATLCAFEPVRADGDAILPVSQELCAEMKAHNVIHVSAPIGCSRLSLLRFSYFDFVGGLHSDGEIVVMDALAESVRDIFLELREAHFPLQRVRGIQQYNGDDDASMRDNNTSAFNHRNVADTATISLHAYGAAIDINPVQNPFIKKAANVGVSIQPESGNAYLSRDSIRPGMAEAVIDIFARNGFVIWGGNWKNPIDYQHFQLPRHLAQQLALLPTSEAQVAFRSFVSRYRACREHHLVLGTVARQKCASLPSR